MGNANLRQIQRHVKSVEQLRKISTDKILDLNAVQTYFGIGKDCVAFIGFENQQKFKEITLSMYRELNKDVFQTVSLKEFTNKLISLLRQLRTEQRKCDQSDIHNLINTLLQLKVIDFELFYPIYGFELEIDALKIGNIWTIYNYHQLQSELESKYANFEKKRSSIFDDDQNSKLLLGIMVSCRDHTKAIELADGLVDTFEIVSSFMIGDVFHNKDFGVFKSQHASSRRRLLCQNDVAGVSLSRKQTYVENLTDKHFLCSKCGNNEIWEIFENRFYNKSSTDIEDRIFRAVQWIGKGLLDSDLTLRFLQVAFSIDSLISTGGGGGEQLSTYGSKILTQNEENEEDIKKNIKIIYKLRSALAHGSSSDKISFKEVSSTYRYAKQIVKIFLTSDPYKSFKNFEEVKNYLNLHPSCND